MLCFYLDNSILCFDCAMLLFHIQQVTQLEEQSLLSPALSPTKLNIDLSPGGDEDVPTRYDFQLSNIRFVASLSINK